MSGNSTQIAGRKTADDWQAARSMLVVDGDSGSWQKAFEDYFKERLRLRYLDPIRILQEHGTLQGEGFSVLAIQCSLIEFLESTVQGLTYRHLGKGGELGPHEYSTSRALFVHFLCNRHPFANHFSETLATDFYVSIRCALLHEARTKNGWKIWAVGPPGMVVDGAKSIVYRDGFQVALDGFVTWYGTALLSNTELQKGFIRKFDSLCQ